MHGALLVFDAAARDNPHGRDVKRPGSASAFAPTLLAGLSDRQN